MGEYRQRQRSPAFEGMINLWAIPYFPDLFMSRNGHFWSTARSGLRQRKMNRYNRMLMLRVSRNGHAANWLGGSLVMLAHLHDTKVHWDGTKIVPGWTGYEVDHDAGEGPAVSLDSAPRPVVR